MALFDQVEYGEVLTPKRIAQFLASEQWTCHSNKSYEQTWIPPESRHPFPVRLPTDATLQDFENGLLRAVDSIRSIYGWATSDLAESIAAISVDLFFIRIVQSMLDGTIPFRQARSVIDNIEGIIRSTALTTSNPNHAGKGRAPIAVNDFLEEDLRLGHTKKGSFIITVAARHEDSSLGSPQPAIPSLEQERDMPVSFSRRVMTNLSRNLSLTGSVAASGDYESRLDEMHERGIREPFLRSLSDLGHHEGLRGVDMTFEWSKTHPQSPSVNDHIEFTSTTFSRVDTIAQSFKSEYSPRETKFSGQVLSLNKDTLTGDEQDGGTVIIDALLEEGRRKVRVDLRGEDYKLAIRAHERNEPVAISGILARHSRNWWVEGAVTIRQFSL